jgi:tetratricopeptide (TPR) repeat protein
LQVCIALLLFIIAAAPKFCFSKPPAAGRGSEAVKADGGKVKVAGANEKNDICGKPTKAELVDVSLQLGDLYSATGKTDLAIEEYLSVVDMDPRNARAHYFLGMLYGRSDIKRDKAVYHLRQYLRYARDDADREEVSYFIAMLGG